LHRHKEQIFSKKQHVLEAVKVIFDVSGCMLRQFVIENKMNFHSKHVFLLGGTIINTDFGLENYVEIQSFEYINLNDY
jgi:hypothetical protein